MIIKKKINVDIGGYTMCNARYHELLIIVRSCLTRSLIRSTFIRKKKKERRAYDICCLRALKQTWDQTHSCMSTIPMLHILRNTDTVLWGTTRSNLVQVVVSMWSAVNILKIAGDKIRKKKEKKKCITSQTQDAMPRQDYARIKTG